LVSFPADPLDPVLLWQDPKTHLFHAVIPLRKSFHDEETYCFEIFDMSKSVLRNAIGKSGCIAKDELSVWRMYLEELTPVQFLEKLKSVQPITPKGKF
jgi:hypothetical protein